MCSIIAWEGKLPKGLLSHLLVQGEKRGKDSTGLAFRKNGRNLSYRLACSASSFVKDCDSEVGEARRSLHGIAHTRRASPGMPVNDTNAHPFLHVSTFYAHNGRVENWRDLQNGHHYTTDSMVLGKYIINRDFSEVKGSLGLVWLNHESVYAFHHAKELVCATIHWTSETETEEQSLTVVASTQKIILTALADTKTIQYKVGFIDLLEGHVYRLISNGILDEGIAPVNQDNHQDDFSSLEEDFPGLELA